MPLALEAQSLNLWTAREVPKINLNIEIYLFICSVAWHYARHEMWEEAKMICS